jgi:hypothetical protein
MTPRTPSVRRLAHFARLGNDHVPRGTVANGQSEQCVIFIFIPTSLMLLTGAAAHRRTARPPRAGCPIRNSHTDPSFATTTGTTKTASPLSGQFSSHAGTAPPSRRGNRHGAEWGKEVRNRAVVLSSFDCGGR